MMMMTMMAIENSLLLLLTFITLSILVHNRTVEATWPALFPDPDDDDDDDDDNDDDDVDVGDNDDDDWNREQWRPLGRLSFQTPLIQLGGPGLSLRGENVVAQYRLSTVVLLVLYCSTLHSDHTFSQG